MIRPLTKKVLKCISHLVPSTKLRCYLLCRAGYVIGKDVYIPSSLVISDLKERSGNVIIGDRVSIGPNVLIITDSSPNNSRLSTIYPLISEKVHIEADVWIGASVVILPGIRIGECSVIGSGSVVTKNIPAYSVAVGNPAKVVKTLLL